MQILIIDNNIDPDSWGATELRRMACIAQGATIHVRRAPHDDLPRDARAFDRIIASGSRASSMEEAPWISRLEEFIRGAAHENKPFLGICYGHQILARALGGKTAVRKAKAGEFGWPTVELLEGAASSPLMKNMPRTFHTFAWHHDEVCELPSEMRNLAKSRDCDIQAYQIGNRPIFGVQFHPERSFEAGERALARRRTEDPKATFINREHGKKLFDEKIGLTLFHNFLNLEKI